MKRITIIITLIIVGFAGGLYSQDHNKQHQKEMQQVSDKMGKPIFEQSVEGINVQVWVITQEEHKKMMAEKMKDSDHPMKEEAKHMDMKKMDESKKKEAMDMKKMDDSKMHDMKDGKMKEMMGGTHHVMVQLNDEKTGKGIDSAAVEIQITSPSQKSSTTKLMGMMKHFGGSLSLDEKGTYNLTTLITIDGKVRSAKFDYNVK